MYLDDHIGIFVGSIHFLEPEDVGYQGMVELDYTRDTLHITNDRPINLPNIGVATTIGLDFIPDPLNINQDVIPQISEVGSILYGWVTELQFHNHNTYLRLTPTPSALSIIGERNTHLVTLVNLYY